MRRIQFRQILQKPSKTLLCTLFIELESIFDKKPVYKLQPEDKINDKKPPMTFILSNNTLSMCD